LAVMHWLPDVISFDKPAYLFFNICLVYVAFRRITSTEKQLVAVKQDLETARNIQNAILPGKSPKSKSYEIASAYVPMALIGGDYYDYQMKDETHIGVLIADVSGHGISAALIASMVKVAFNSQFSYTKQPAMVLEQMNRSLSGQLNNEFITAGYFGVDLQKNKLIYSSAGHPPLVLYRRRDDAVTEVKVAGIPIGIYADTHYTEATLNLVQGDRLFLYTDGLLDVLNPGNEAFGRIRFMELVNETKNLLPEKAIAFILRAIQKWSEKNDTETYDDDITLIIFDIKVNKTVE
jgi:sigma-B regulation protein RsbU (phosphoserine phosphatase)